MKLLELFAKTDKNRYDFQLASKPNKKHRYTFLTDDSSIVEVGFYDGAEGFYELSFQRDGKQDLTGGGDAVKIFNTVIAITQDFVIDEEPNGIMFDAVKSEQSRVAFYRRLVKRLAKGEYVDATKLKGKLKNDEAREHFGWESNDAEAFLIAKKSELDESAEG